MSSELFTIDGFRVGPGEPCRIVAEVGQAHDGSLGTAHAYIDAIADAGADAVKFQTHIASAESTPSEPFRVRVFPQDASRYDYWKRMEFKESEWRELFAHARRRGLIFLSSAFSTEAFELLERIGCPAWKVASGELTNFGLIRKLARTRKPVLLSSGMSSWRELDAAVEVVRSEQAPLFVYQCTSAYPCPPERVGLNVLDELRRRYGCPVGLSDHSGTIHAGLAAATLGASMLEVHVVFSRACFGPDTPASVTLEELKTLVSGTHFIHDCVRNPVDKDRTAEGMAELKRLFQKSLVLACDLPAGHELRPADLGVKKPGTGIPAERLEEVVGKRLKRSLLKDDVLNDDDLA